MKITILGCGSSGGVPLIGCECAVCRSDDPKNKRTRASVLVETDAGTRILIDTAPDLRAQALRERLSLVHAIIYTHAHADHCHGIDDLRSFNFHADAPLQVYGDAETLGSLKARFDYAFLPRNAGKAWYRPALIANRVKPGETREIAGANVTFFEQTHGTKMTLGIRIGDFAYSTDLSELREDNTKKLAGVKLWIVDCLKRTPSPGHSHLEQTLSWISRVKPERAILTHMAHELEYNALKQELSGFASAQAEPGFDGFCATL